MPVVCTNALNQRVNALDRMQPSDEYAIAPVHFEPELGTQRGAFVRTDRGVGTEVDAVRDDGHVGCRDTRREQLCGDLAAERDEPGRACQECEP